MNPSGKKSGGSAEDSRRGRALDRAVRKVEAKEKAQDDKSGKAGKQVPSVGRSIRRGRIENA